MKTNKNEFTTSNKSLAPQPSPSIKKVNIPLTSKIVSKKIIELIDDPFINVTLIKKIISADPTLSFRLIKHANNFHFSKTKEIVSINQTIMTLGWRNIRGIIASACFSNARNEDNKQDLFFFKNTILRTSFCSNIARLINIKIEDEVCTTSLLLEIGRLAIIENYLEKYEEVLAQVKNGFSFKEAEQTTFGFISLETSEFLLEKWNFPCNHSNTIRILSNGPEKQITNKQKMIADIISISELLSLKSSMNEKNRFNQAIEKLSSNLGLDEKSIRNIERLSMISSKETHSLFSGSISKA